MVIFHIFVYVFVTRLASGSKCLELEEFVVLLHSLSKDKFDGADSSVL